MISGGGEERERDSLLGESGQNEDLWTEARDCVKTFLQHRVNGATGTARLRPHRAR